MNPIEMLRKRLASRHETNEQTFWRNIESLAGDSLNERGADAALAAIEPLLPLLKKSPDDVALDIAACREAAASKDAEAAMAAAERESKALVVEAGAVEAKVEAARVEFERLNARAQDLRHRANAALQGARERLRIARQARRQLGERGHPGFGEYVPPTSGYAQVGGGA